MGGCEDQRWSTFPAGFFLFNVRSALKLPEMVKYTLKQSNCCFVSNLAANLVDANSSCPNGNRPLLLFPRC